VEEKVFYVTIKGEKDQDYKVEKLSDGSYEITTLETVKGAATKNAGETATSKKSFKVGNFDLEYSSLLRFNVDGDKKLTQFIESKEELNYNFYHKGNTLEC
jgi:hypothetical protein